MPVVSSPFEWFWKYCIGCCFFQSILRTMTCAENVIDCIGSWICLFQVSLLVIQVLLVSFRFILSNKSVLFASISTELLPSVPFLF